MQKIAALSNLVCYYCIGLPVGIALMFAAELRILGNTHSICVCFCKYAIHVIYTEQGTFANWYSGMSSVLSLGHHVNFLHYSI